MKNMHNEYQTIARLEASNGIHSCHNGIEYTANGCNSRR